MAYEDIGEGRPVVLLHGAWASHDWWRWQIPDLSRRFRLLLPDLRGHGRSSPIPGGFSVTDYSRDIERLLDSLALDECALVGWSLGGMVAMQYGLDHPSRVSALVLMGARGHRSRTLKARMVFRYLRSLTDLLWELSAPRKYDRTGLTARRQSAARARREAERLLAPGTPREVFDWMVSALEKSPREGYFPVARCIWRWEAGEALGRVRAPVLILSGTEDRWTVPRYTRLLHAEIPESRLVLVEGAGHYLPLEQPDRVNREIAGFLEETAV